MIERSAVRAGGWRVAFFGTPAFAVPSLTALANHDNVAVCLVVTQPDRPAGRQRRLHSPPVKVAAEGLGLPVLQPLSLRDQSVQTTLRNLGADLFVVAAFGRIFGRSTLEAPRSGCLNLHASILPGYRGASPIAGAILDGADVTGVSLMKMDRGLDTGAVLATIEEPISAGDTTESLTERLADRAAALLEASLKPYLRGALVATPQGAGATLTRPLTKEDGWLDWSEPAEALERRVRALWPWPRAWTTVDTGVEKVVLQVHSAEVSRQDDASAGPPGALSVREGAFLIRCGAGALKLNRVQLPGGQPQPFDVVARRFGLRDGAKLGLNPPARSDIGIVSPVAG